MILTAIVDFVVLFLEIDFYAAEFYKLQNLETIKVIMVVLILGINITALFSNSCPNCSSFLEETLYFQVNALYVGFD